MPADFLLALDAGTSAARAVIVRRDGPTAAVARREWAYETPPDAGPLARSFDPERFWSLLCAAAREALTAAGVTGSDIAAVGVTSQRLANVAVDREGRGVYGGPNSDARAVAEGLAIDARMAERIYETTGKLPSLILAPARIQWLAKHLDGGLGGLRAMFTLADWVVYRLSGELRAERSLAADCGLLNVATREYDDALLAELELPRDLLPALVDAGEVVGGVTAEAAAATGLAAGAPVVACGADSQCGLAGMGVNEPGEAGIITGWSCTVHQVTAEVRLDRGRRTWAGLHVLPDRWVVESSAANAGQVWRWWCETLAGNDDGVLERAAELAAGAPPGARNLLAMLGPAAMNAAAMGVHLGGLLMTTPVAVDSIGRAELLRAVIENIAYALRANLEQTEHVAGRPAGRIALGGGLTRVAVFPALLAGVLGRPLDVAGELETSSRGAAVITARAAGFDEVQPAETRRVEPDAGAVALYEQQYQRWRRLAAALDGAMRELG